MPNDLLSLIANDPLSSATLLAAVVTAFVSIVGFFQQRAIQEAQNEANAEIAEIKNRLDVELAKLQMLHPGRQELLNRLREWANQGRKMEADTYELAGQIAPDERPRVEALIITIDQWSDSLNDYLPRAELIDKDPPTQWDKTQIPTRLDELLEEYRGVLTYAVNYNLGVFYDLAEGRKFDDKRIHDYVKRYDSQSLDAGHGMVLRLHDALLKRIESVQEQIIKIDP